MNNIVDQILMETGKAYQVQREPAFSYERVSTEEQKEKGYSLSDQGERAKQYAQDNNLHIVYVFSAAESAFREGRVQFNRMIDLAAKHNIKNFIFKNTDRLGRNDIDWPRLKKLARNEGYKIHLYEFSTVFEENSKAEIEMFLDNTSTMAKYWSNKISQGVKDSYAKKAKEGIAPQGLSPVGYKYNSEKKVHIKDESSSNLINYIFDTFDNSSISIEILVNDLNSQGFKTGRGLDWNKTTLHRVLSSRFYAGEFEYKETAFKGNHEPYITKERYEKRLKKLGLKYRAKARRDTNYLFKGFLRTPEGRVLTGTTQTGAHNSGEYIYYVNYKPEYVSIREDELLELVGESVEDIRYSTEFADFMKEVFRDSVIKQDNEQSKNKFFVSKRIAKLESEQKKLLKLLVEGVDSKTIKIQMDENRKIINHLEDQYKKFRLNEQHFIFHVSDIIDDIKDFPAVYQVANHQEKAELLTNFADRITVGEEKIEINWKKPYSFILNPEVLRYIKDNRVTIYSIRGSERNDLVTLLRNDISVEWQLWFVA